MLSSQGSASAGSSGGRSHQGGAQDPGRTQRADHPAGLGAALPVGRLHRHPADQLGAEAALLLGGGAADPGDLGRDLGPQVVPGVAAARGREGTQLERSVVTHQDHGTDVTGRLVDLEAHLRPVVGDHDDAAEVDASVLLEVLLDVDLRLVEGSDRREVQDPALLGRVGLVGLGGAAALASEPHDAEPPVEELIWNPPVEP